MFSIQLSVFVARRGLNGNLPFCNFIRITSTVTFPIMSIIQFSIQKEYEKSGINPTVIDNLRKWVMAQPHLPHKYITDLELILAYYCCECNMESTKQVIDLNYTLRTMFSFYSNRMINKSLEVALSTWLITPLSEATIKGYRAVYCQLLDENPNNFIYSDVVKAFVMIMDLWQYEEGTVPGTALIVNMDKVTLAHVSRIDFHVAQEFFFFLQEAMFIRLKEFHFINAPSFADKMINIIKPLLKKETLDLLKVHTAGSNTLEQYLSLTSLPKDAGGNNKHAFDLRNDIWNKIKANKDYFEDEAKKRVDETKRPGGPKTITTVFPGLEESFKKLDID